MNIHETAAADPRILYDAKPESFFLPSDISAPVMDRAIALAKEIEPDGRKAKFYVFDALTILCPLLDRKQLAKRLSFYLPLSADEQLRRASGRKWWQSAATDHVIGGFVEALYGEQAD